MEIIFFTKRTSKKLLKAARLLRKTNRVRVDEGDVVGAFFHYVSGDSGSIDESADTFGFSRDSIKSTGTKALKTLELEYRKVLIPKGSDKSVQKAIDVVINEHADSLLKKAAGKKKPRGS